MKAAVKKTTAFFVAALFFFPGCAAHSKDAPKENSIQRTPESFSSQEVSIGRQINQQILASFAVYTDPATVDYVNQVSGKLSRHAERQDIPYQVTLLYSDKLYATSAPGGFIYVTTAMMNFLQNEAELASVLGHEIARLQYRDPTLSEARKKLQQVSQAGAMVSSAFGSIGALAALGFVALGAASTPHAMSPEKRLIDADRRAMEYLLAAGYDPQAMLDVMERFLRISQKDLPFFYDYYQARPITQERVLQMEQDFKKLPLRDQKLITGYPAYQEMNRGIREIYRH